ncbi:hypothetical protein LOTGIDRAFT_210857 [Lottia gigantea]|uniref:Uncharacterized protein n=1 Tax=Lottia gigantea TaxID=225164 RepID=V3ZSV5_LOTGI|nr:hypothetical protein LOTGIDRAFT_210857 [Lottia gigantea]ESO85655.1 hypothetical protein LOTGIDRAFT_210857 [Lottia gigantea]
MSTTSNKTSSSNSSQSTQVKDLPFTPSSGLQSAASIDTDTSQEESVKIPKKSPMKGFQDEILREVCANNGLNFNKLENGEGESLGVFEMFFSGYPQLIGLKYFPNLHTLTVIGQTVDKIQGLNSLSKLKELWLCECEIKKIENLSHLKTLHKLYLYSNKINKIENLSTLTQLEVLWLNNNHIENIENISALSKLKEINLAENNIKLIGHSFDANIGLTELNLSGNPLSSLTDLTNLIRLPFLKSLSFKDPQYQPCPVSILCNYSIHLLYHLPTLQRLDTYDVSSKQLAELAESTVNKKKMYYNMRVKTIHCNLTSVIIKLEKYRDLLLEFPHQKIMTLVSAIKELEREEEIQVLSADVNSDTESERDAKGIKENTEAKSTKAIVEKIQVLKKRRKEWEEKCAQLTAHCEDSVKRIKEQSERLISRLTIELETGGNVRFEDGTPSDVWFSSCHDLVLSRFCSADYRDRGIMGIKIHRIIRIHHRMLRTKFDNKLNDLTDDKTVEEFSSTK